MNDNLDRRVSLFEDLQAESFYKEHDHEALREAQTAIGPYGFIATLPQAVRDRINLGQDEKIWNNKFACMSDEYQGVAQGKKVLVTVHGGAYLNDPALLEQAVRNAQLTKEKAELIIDAAQKKLTLATKPEEVDAAYKEIKAVRKAMHEHLSNISYASSVRVNDAAIDALVRGITPEGGRMPVYALKEYIKMDAIPPGVHAIVSELVESKNDKGTQDDEIPYNIKVNGRIYRPALVKSIDAAYEDPLFIARAGGMKNAKAYLDRLVQMEAKIIRNDHHFRDFDAEKPIGYKLQLNGFDLQYGFGFAILGSDARFIGVKLAPQDEATARKSYFFIAHAHGNGLPKPAEGVMPELLMKATATPPPRGRTVTPPEGYDGRTIAPPETARLMAAMTGQSPGPATPPPAPRIRKATMGGNDEAILPPAPKSNGGPTPPPRRNGSGGKM